jgi:ADP-heptose:LPS heptosyltransferase
VKRRVLAIRLQATGDVVITLPYLNDVKHRDPEVEIDLLTREESASIPKSLELFSRVFALGGGRNFKLQCLWALLLMPVLLGRRYHTVLDLQNNELSRFVTRALRPERASLFDKESPIPAGERTRRAIVQGGFANVGLATDLRPRRQTSREALLANVGAPRHPSGELLVVLNPAGAFPSRNWPLPNYVAFARELRERIGQPVRFLLLGLSSLRPKADYLRNEIGSSVTDLVGRTRASEAFALVKHADLVVSEDSGLMHMSWVSGVPTLALFGSSRGEWSRPLGDHSLCLDSSDLECRYCMEPECRHGDLRCLVRRTPQEVARLAIRLLRSEARE